MSRLVGQKPERMSMTLLGAPCDALDCAVEDLCQVHVAATAQRKSAVNGPEAVDVHTTIRPERARVRPTPSTDAHRIRASCAPLDLEHHRYGAIICP
ncbi:helix-turn-helix domain-containing protein [Arthrobacter sp. CAN_A214]|uniref:helix-turn-helix domain-containing protein n=1 Tax=Arthrobacter sp. CAN_A214 TaxID=2787720 RepID=UPI003FA4B9D7